MNALHLAKEIKVRLTFREAAALVGIHDLPRDDVKFRSPLRPDRNPSCTIHKEVMTDWSRRENFDAISFYAAAKGVGNAEAIRQLADRLGIRNTAPRQTPKAAPKESQHGHASFQCFEPSDADFAVILQTRKLPHEAESGLFLAWSLGILEFGSVHGFRSWIVTDESRRIAEARRLDGQPFPALGSLGTRKSHTLKGSKKDWAVGLAPGTCRNLSDLPPEKWTA